MIQFLLVLIKKIQRWVGWNTCQDTAQSSTEGDYMIYQTDKGLDPVIQKYGCLFMSLAWASDIKYTAMELNKIWYACIAKGHISGDLNRDGDMDDNGEAEILSHDGVARELGSCLAYTNAHNSPTVNIPAGYYAIGAYYNPRTRFTHFVVINRDKEVVYDPIPHSVTVREGYLKSIRIYKVTGKIRVV